MLTLSFPSIIVFSVTYWFVQCPDGCQEVLQSGYHTDAGEEEHKPASDCLRLPCNFGVFLYGGMLPGVPSS